MAWWTLCKAICEKKELNIICPISEVVKKTRIYDSIKYYCCIQDILLIYFSFPYYRDTFNGQRLWKISGYDSRSPYIIDYILIIL